MNFNNNLFLIQELKNGNDKAFNFLMETYYKNLCGYAYTLTNDKAFSEDIVQNVFVSIWTNKNNLKPNFSIKSYLFRSVYNEFIDQYRKNKPVINLEKKYLEALDIVVEKSDGEINELIDLVNKEINKLPSKCKQIFLLNKKEGLTHIEIAEYLNISIKTIEGHMTRAFKILSKKLGKEFNSIFFLLFDFKKQVDLSKISCF
ncbi:RNA polymerase sigma-70 factor [Lutibacter sp. A80]|uniref:RNA polymerase sigma factor n=1 Tax=Lutibacter sp. A80 TaxID=2918453 RepID=UPI001F06EA96|nr:RNA polymerase sigma-70 factor [Lutibacter sp. A80]UMB59564.1 RNA polymerase sigma-70 factor [Lutibacter sp. A80]